MTDQIHPYEELLPEMSADEFSALTRPMLAS